jgi:putative transposase
MHADDLRTVVDAMLYIAQTGCQWRYLPESFGPWTRVWSQFRRWSRNGTWAQALTVLHAAAGESGGRAERTPSLVVIDTHLARGASNGGLTFHDRGGPYGRTKGAKRVVAVDVTGLPVAALGPPAPSGIRSLTGHPPEARGMRLLAANRNRQVRRPWRLGRCRASVMRALDVS